ncbi:MAG: hypothetical protein ACO3N3_02945 [bacterium]
MSKVQFAITIGNFDGLHLGHRALIETTIQASHSFAGKSALVTFDPHPQEVLGNRPVERINSRFHQEQRSQKAYHRNTCHNECKALIPRPWRSLSRMHWA